MEVNYIYVEMRSEQYNKDITLILKKKMPNTMYTLNIIKIVTYLKGLCFRLKSILEDF